MRARKYDVIFVGWPDNIYIIFNNRRFAEQLRDARHLHVSRHRLVALPHLPEVHTRRAPPLLYRPGSAYDRTLPSPRAPQRPDSINRLADSESAFLVYTLRRLVCRVGRSYRVAGQANRLPLRDERYAIFYSFSSSISFITHWAGQPPASGVKGMFKRVSGSETRSTRARVRAPTQPPLTHIVAGRCSV